jgi:hypothetical protein
VLRSESEGINNSSRNVSAELEMLRRSVKNEVSDTGGSATHRIEKWILSYRPTSMAILTSSFERRDL